MGFQNGQLYSRRLTLSSTAQSTVSVTVDTGGPSPDFPPRSNLIPSTTSRWSFLTKKSKQKQNLRKLPSLFTSSNSSVTLHEKVQIPPRMPHSLRRQLMGPRCLIDEHIPEELITKGIGQGSKADGTVWNTLLWKRYHLNPQASDCSPLWLVNTIIRHWFAKCRLYFHPVRLLKQRNTNISQPSSNHLPSGLFICFTNLVDPPGIPYLRLVHSLITV